MEVNLQIGINGDELNELSPEFIELDDPYSKASSRLEIEILENEYGDGAYDSEIEYVKDIFDEDNILGFQDEYIRLLEDIIDLRQRDGSFV